MTANLFDPDLVIMSPIVRKQYGISRSDLEFKVQVHR